MEDPRFLVLRLYAPLSERILLDFLPLRRNLADPGNPSWEDWHTYRTPLTVYRTDYQPLLLPYLEPLFPLRDPVDNTLQPALDLCFDNWIGREAWEQFCARLQSDLPQKAPAEQRFYRQLLGWLRQALQQVDVIVVAGNL